MRLWLDLLVAFIIFLLLVIPLWKICGKTGLSPALSLTILIPVLGWPILLMALAFSHWPKSSRSTPFTAE